MSFLAAWILAGAPVYAEMRSAQWTELRDASPTLADRASASNPYRLRPAPGQPVVRESLVEKSALPFRDLLVSWNVDAPPRTAFVVELRVGTEPDGGVSAWMHVGDWGVPAFAPGADNVPPRPKRRAHAQRRRRIMRHQPGQRGA